MSGGQRSATGFLRVFFVSSLALAGLTIIGTLAWHHLQDAREIARTLDQAGPWLAAWRALLFIGLIGTWPRWVAWLAHRYRWPDAQRRHVLAQRWRVAAWLIVIELLLVQNVAGRFINALVP